MATSGTNNTVKWTLSNGVLTISPKSGSSGIAIRPPMSTYFNLRDWITLTDDEVKNVQSIKFTGNIQLYTKTFIDGTTYKETNLGRLMYDFSNASEIDVSGLNTAGVKDFSRFFPRSLMNLIGLSSMNVASGKDFSYMFDDNNLESLDLSTFPLNSADDITYMLSDMSYCHTVKLPSNFSRKFARIDSDSGQKVYSFGLASNSIPATKDGVTVTSDEDFFKLDSAQGGTWTRDISGSATLSFQVKSTSREANIATINYKYATSSATVSIYLKKASESSFPSTVFKTVEISGTGSGSVEIELATDDAYDIKMVAFDGSNSIYAYPSVGSNILLFEVDEEGNVEFSGGITTGGDVHAEGNTGYFKDVYLKNQTAHIGQVFSWQGSLKSNLTANVDSYVESNGTITLPGGHTYAVFAYISITNSTNGATNRRLQIFNKTANVSVITESVFVAGQNWGTLNTMYMWYIENDITLCFRGAANRPTTTIPNGWIRAVCIA